MLPFKYDAEFRRFGLGRASISKFADFYTLVERLHGLNGIQFNICYTDKDGDLLPINNDMNLARVLQVTAGILRLIIQRKGECYNTYPGAGGAEFTGSNKSFAAGHPNDLTSASYRATTNLISRIKDLKDLSTTLTSSASSHGGHFMGGGGAGGVAGAKPFQISYPEDFRPVSAIIDVDVVPDTYRRVRLHKHKSSKPLGFYIRDGRSLRVTPQGVEQVPGIFISRLMPGGLAESTGLLSVNDEVIEVNGIEVAGKTLDQVTDMMGANSSNLSITVKPTHQRYNLNRSHTSTVISTASYGAPAPKAKATAASSTPTVNAAAAAVNTTPQTAASRLHNTTTTTGNSNSAVKFSTSHQKSEAPLAPSAVKAATPPHTTATSPSHQESARYANSSQTLQNQHINDDDDDEEEIHDATGANGSYGDDDADPDNSDDKILTL